MRHSWRRLIVAIEVLVALAAAQPTAAQPPSAYWKLDEGQGMTITDTLGTNPGTVVGATWVPGVVGTALAFDGIDDHINIPCETQNADLQRISTFTLEVWINLTSETHYPGVFAKPAGFSAACGFHFGWGILIRHGQVWVWSNEDGYWPWRRSIPTIQQNTWHHIAVTSRYVAYAQREFHIYIDGVEVATETFGPGLTILATPHIYIGGGSTAGLLLQQLFRGAIDELAIFPRVLTAEEIRRHYESSRNGSGYLNDPPTADAGADATAECSGASGTLVTLNGSGSSDSNGDQLTYTWRENGHIIAGPSTTPTAQVSLSHSPHTIELTVDDGNGASDTDEVVIHIVDTTAPTLDLVVSPNKLWPPNHSLSAIAATISVADACDPAPAIELVSIVSNEPDDGLGDGDTSNDTQHAAFGTDDRSFLLRAERSGQDSGRTYTITYRARDASGNTTVKTATVIVPKNQRE